MGGGGAVEYSRLGDDRRDDRDDRRIFLGVKILILRFVWAGKFGKYFWGVA